MRSVQPRLTFHLLWLISAICVIWDLLSLGAPARAADRSSNHLSNRLSNPRWVDDAVIYGVAPWYISRSPQSRFRDIAERLPEIKALGVNTLWLQPIYATHAGGQAYDVIDYFRVWDELGSLQDLRNLVRQAKRLGFRVLFDFVPNHLSIHHPFARDVIAHGSLSKYANFFQSQPDRAPYSRYYNARSEGRGRFLFYFWNDLININFEDATARRYIEDAAVYWVRELGIDGYRFDAVWGPVARAPEFMLRLRDRLRSIRPDFAILAEDKAAFPDAYRGTRAPTSAQIFDLAYDWSASEIHVSEWAWSRDGHQETIFNAVASDDRVSELRRSLSPSLDDTRVRARVLRFIENNDVPRFVEVHGPDVTKLAAFLTLTLPGVPLLYYGQEVCTAYHYPTYPRFRQIREFDRFGCYAFYRGVLRLRAERPELRRGDYQELKVEPKAAEGRVFAFKRSWRGKATVAVVNLGDRLTEAWVRVPDSNGQVLRSPTLRLTPYGQRVFRLGQRGLE